MENCYVEDAEGYGIYVTWVQKAKTCRNVNVIGSVRQKCMQAF